MTKLYIITGPAGVGKSTVSTKIAELKNKSVLIEGDNIYHQVIGGYVPAWKVGNHLDVFWNVCIETIKIYLNNGYDVIFNYIVSPNDLFFIKTNLTNCEIKFVVLLADESILLSRDCKRSVDCQMGERCIVLLNNIKEQYENSINILDTSNLSVDDVVSCIEHNSKYLL